MLRYPCRILAFLIACTIFSPIYSARGQSALDGFDPGANNYVVALAVQPDGKIVVGGGFTMLGGGGTGTTPRSKIGRLNPDGSLDTSFNPGADGTVFALAVQADGKILVGGDFTTLGGGGTGTTTRNYIGRLNPDGSLDADFNPGANSFIRALAVQPDGKILVAGNFTTLGGGGTGTTTRNYIGRLNPDGGLDTNFDPGANSLVTRVAVQADGKILVGGTFTTLGGGGTGTTTRNYIGRLNAEGGLDTGFDPGASDSVIALAVQPDSKIVVGGTFTTLGGGGTGTTPRNKIGRLNADGSLDTSFNPGADTSPSALALQADGKILVGGAFTTLGGGGTGTTPRNKIGRLNPDGSLDTSFDPGANDTVSTLAVQPDGKILVGGLFTTLGGGGVGTTTRNKIGRMYPEGSLDTDFDPGADNVVLALAVQPDGKILVGGAFTKLGGGGTGTPPRRRIGRLNPDGSLDTSFDPGANGAVYALAVQPDGKILVGGVFTTLGGGGGGTTTRNFIGRLNPNGSLDTSFDPGANDGVYALAVQPDGKILVGGQFTTLGGGGAGTTMRRMIGQLNPDGSLETSFDPGANGAVYALAVQADGKILVGGPFTTLGGGGAGTTTRNRIGQLNPDGSLDTSFDPGANDAVYALAMQADGKILLGGDFTTLGGGGTGTTPRNYIGRLNPDGSVDSDFYLGTNGRVNSVAVQTDGKILLGGDFATLGGGETPRNYIGRLNPDGSVDPSFVPGANSGVQALAVQRDGKILVGGWFTTLVGGGMGTTLRNYIGRLTNTEAALENLEVDGTGSVITWLRSGAGSEVERVTFESSTDAIDYSPLGVGARVEGGWQLSAVTFPTNQNIFLRARGFFQAGRSNASGSIVESVREVFLPLPPSSKAEMTSPAPGSTLTSSMVTFSWTAGVGVNTYSMYVGHSVGAGDIYIGNFGTNLSGTVTGLPTDGSTLFVRLYSLIGSSWEFNDYTYTAASASKAVMTSPTPSSTLSASTVTFTWNAGSGVSQYALYVGTTAGGTEIYADLQGTSLTRTLGGLPTDGSTVHVRLWSLISGAWEFNDYTYTAMSASKAVMVSPAPGSTLTSSKVTFTWSAGAGATMYALYVGTTEGGMEIYADTQGTNLSVTVGGLSTNGSLVYVRLWSLIGGGWQFNDYSYTAVSSSKAAMTDPTPGSTLTSGAVTFTWSAGSGASMYALYVGTTAGGTEIYADTQGTNLSVTVGGLPTNGSTVHVRLWSLLGGEWQFNDYTYTAAGFSKAAMVSPTPGSTLTSSTVSFTWSGGAGATMYALYVGTTPGGTELYADTQGTNLSATVGGLPSNGSPVYLRLWTLLGDVWQFNDYTYTACTGCQ